MKLGKLALIPRWGIEMTASQPQLSPEFPRLPPEFPQPPALTSETALPPALQARLKRNQNGLFAAIAQQYDTLQVLMLAWMDDEALRRTLETHKATYWSRSRNEYWCKGDTSGHYQMVKKVLVDCDGDAVLLLVDQIGAACHTGELTCFHTPVDLMGAG